MKEAYLRTAPISKKNMAGGKGVMSKMNATARGSVNNGASAKAPVNNGASAKALPWTTGEFIANNFNTVLNDKVASLSLRCCPLPSPWCRPAPAPADHGT